LVQGIAEGEAKEPGVKKQMIIVFGLFSMPPGGLNKPPNIDYYVWMDQQMDIVANHPQLAGVGGLEWRTSLQADEESVRFPEIRRGTEAGPVWPPQRAQKAGACLPDRE
jgi:hypothetical protein